MSSKLNKFHERLDLKEHKYLFATPDLFVPKHVRDQFYKENFIELNSVEFTSFQIYPVHDSTSEMVEVEEYIMECFAYEVHFGAYVRNFKCDEKEYIVLISYD